MLDQILIASLKDRVRELRKTTTACDDAHAQTAGNDNEAEHFALIMRQTRRALCCCKPEERWHAEP